MLNTVHRAKCFCKENMIDISMFATEGKINCINRRFKGS